ncbi:MAG: patatin-like phospholipase family protein [Caulobacterales bacterium]|nr:patatin-like phospholipase family protein [Caulobacterales bacterium]
MAEPAPKPVNLALQGGGAHGAFTWGVLDALLEDGRIVVEAISGTSAGAMNAVAYAEGLKRGRERGARACLRRFWEGVARRSVVNAFQPWPYDAIFGDSGAPKRLGMAWLDAMRYFAGPYNFNPLNLNPLRDLLEELIDFPSVRACDDIALYIAATNVETGRTTIFEREELTAAHVMASACLPMLFQAVEIDGIPYWDGGYVGNPPLFPFFYNSTSRDLVVVQINPIERHGVPRAPDEIIDRVNEITFNSSLLREYRNIEFVARQLDEGHLDAKRYRKMLIHRIDGGTPLSRLHRSSRYDTSLNFFEELHARGREAAFAWLDMAWPAIGERSTLDIRAVLDNPAAGV